MLELRKLRRKPSLINPLMQICSMGLYCMGLYGMGLYGMGLYGMPRSLLGCCHEYFRLLSLQNHGVW